MHIGPPDFARAFDDIRKTSQSHASCKVFIFVSSLDIDALCAASMLSTLLKAELILHKIVPIVGYSELKTHFHGLGSEVVNVICIGCGAIIDLESYLEITPNAAYAAQQPAGRKIYLIDNHRPWNLDNVFGSEAIVCLNGDRSTNMDDHREAYDYLANESDDEDEDEVIHSDNEEVNDVTDTDEDSGKSPKQKETGSGDDDDEEAEEEEEQIVVRRRKRDVQSKHLAQLEAYYAQGSYVGSSNATQMYTLISALGETNIDHLWSTVIGATSLDSQHPDIYNELFPVLRDEVARLCPGGVSNGSINGNGHSESNGNGLGVSSLGDNTLLAETEYSLFLLRHWSLYESMIHSSYLSAKLQLWTEDGRKRLHKMLAKMGISLHDAKEQWSHMNLEIKRNLKNKLALVSGMYDVEGVVRQGVVRKFGYKGSVSAGETVVSLTALLQAGAGTGISTNSESRQELWITNFWAGWDALSDVNLLLSGMDRAKQLQQAVVATGSALFEKRQIKELRSYRLAVAREGPDLGLFTNPLALTRLGEWVAEACAETHSTPLPLVIAALDEPNDAYLVLGMGAYLGRDTDSRDPADQEYTYNRFGPAFNDTAKRINARLRIDAFDSSIIEIARDDLSRFLEALTMR